MDEQMKDLALLERYIENDLSEQEKDRVEARLENEKEFKKSFQDLQKLISGIQYVGRKDLFAQLEKIESALPNFELGEEELRDGKVIPINRKVTIRRWSAIAASILVIIVAGILLLGKQSYTSEALYADYFEKYPNFAEVNTRGEAVASNLRIEAFRAYDQDNFQKASELFKQIPDDNGDASINLYLGISDLYLNNTESAISSLKSGMENSGSLINLYRWYLALAYLKTDRIDEAKSLLETLKNSQNSKQGLADEILRKLEQ